MDDQIPSQQSLKRIIGENLMMIGDQMNLPLLSKFVW